MVHEQSARWRRSSSVSHGVLVGAASVNRRVNSSGYNNYMSVALNHCVRMYVRVHVRAYVRAYVRCSVVISTSGPACQYQACYIRCKNLVIFFVNIKKSKITRGHNFTLVKEQGRLDVTKYSFSQRTINVWNKLSTDCV